MVGIKMNSTKTPDSVYWSFDDAAVIIGGKEKYVSNPQVFSPRQDYARADISNPGHEAVLSDYQNLVHQTLSLIYQVNTHPGDAHEWYFYV
jgi:hypothetical protein